MIVEQALSSLPVCAVCGNPYRPSRWTHPRACPNCGKPLIEAPTPAARPRLNVLPAVAGVLAVVLSYSAVTQLVREWARARPRWRAPVSTLVKEPSSEMLPAGMEESLNEQAQYLEQDLSLVPEDPFLLYALAGTHLQRALFYREQNPDQASRAADEAVRWARRLRSYSPREAETLQRLAKQLDRLQWAQSGTLLRVNQFWPFRVRFSSIYRGGAFLYFNESPSSPELRASWHVGPHVVPAYLFWPLPKNSLSAMSFSTGNGSGFSSSQSLSSTTSGVRAQGQLEKLLPELRRYVQEHPQDLRAADALGNLLARAGILDTAKRSSISEDQAQDRRYLEEAAAIFSTAAQRARPRIYRATLHAAAAECWRANGDARRAYQGWKEAVELAPYVPGLWQSMAQVSILAGEIEEGNRAYREWQRRQFPGIQEEPEPVSPRPYGRRHP